MPRKNNRGSVKTPPTRQRQQRQTTQLGELDTTPTRPDASPSLLTKPTSANGGKDQSFRENIDSDVFEDGLEDGDLVQLADTQAVSNTTAAKEFPWSETGSGARRSSSVSSDGPSRGSYGYFGIGNVFSSPASGSDALPDTVPLPREPIHDPLLEDHRQTPMIVDFSETATTVLRSSPMTESRLSKSLGTSSHRDFADRVWVDDSVCQTPSQPLLMNNNKLIAAKNNQSTQASMEKSGNAFHPFESARATDIDVDDVDVEYVGSATQKSSTHRSAVVNLANHFMSLDGAADRLDHDEGDTLKMTHVATDEKKQKKKRKQRPKSPLRFDNDTQVVKDVVKKPVRKRTCQKSARKKPKPSPSPLKDIVPQEEVAQPSPSDVLVEAAECLPMTRRRSLSVEMKTAMHENEDSLKILNQPPPNNMEDPIHDNPTGISSNLQKVIIMDISEEIEAESYLESPASSGVKTGMSESNSPCTPPTTSTEIRDNETKVYVPVAKDSTRRQNLENLAASLQTDKEEDEGGFAQKQQRRAKPHSSVQQHNVPGSSGLACVNALRTVHDQHGKHSSASKRTNDGKLNLAGVRRSRHISISGRGSPIRLSHCENNAVNLMPTGFSASEVWGDAGRIDCLQQAVSNAARHESTRSNKNAPQEPTFSGALEIEPPKAVSTLGFRDHPGPRRSILSELKKENVNRRVVNGQTKTQFSGSSDEGRQRLHELIDACMRHLDSKKECIAKIADTYTKAGNHCVEKIQSRFERERSAVTRLATEDTANFSKVALDGKKSVERDRAKKGRLMKQFKQAVSARVASYAHASDALDTLHHAMLTGDDACLPLSS
ncbi:hypothetical protein E4U55_001492 [Claviceps digitariae]|nr:hypothetical protein E4U55_001492 [Claviceps digitariae]